MPASSSVFSTPLTKLFKISHPVMLAGMNVAAGPKLAAAVTNSGGLGVIGGVSQTPKFLKGSIEELKSYLEDKNAPFGVDLLLPQVGGNARKTNVDYTDGQLPELIDVIIQGGATLFVSAVGIPPKWAVDRLHEAGIPVMNMVGHPKHVPKALAQGVDIICAQGGEAGGHTGDIPFSVLIPAIVDCCRDAKSPLTGEPVIVALSYGASGVWVGTRFWETARKAEQEQLLADGKVPHEVELERNPSISLEGTKCTSQEGITDIKPAKEIVDELVTTAQKRLIAATDLFTAPRSKL
ncbi:2-nitropropane dioxygenase [Mycena amicta]|nr:2-nitropropane dioxygenase [Mycena amicta]